MKYSILGFFGVLLTTQALFSLGQYALSNLSCQNRVNTTAQVLGTMILVSGITAATVLLFLVKKFRDNFNIHLEILRTTVVYFIGCPLLLTLSFLKFRFPDEQLAAREVIALLFEAFIVIVGVYPLYDQRKLDKAVNESDFEGLERFEDVLQDPASFVALEKFMRRQFCNELLEFYRAFFFFRVCVACFGCGGEHVDELSTPERAG